jgi:hypothetical protein
VPKLQVKHFLYKTVKAQLMRWLKWTKSLEHMDQEVNQFIREVKKVVLLPSKILKLRVLLEKVALVKYSWLRKSQMVKFLQWNRWKRVSSLNMTKLNQRSWKRIFYNKLTIHSWLVWNTYSKQS